MEAAAFSDSLGTATFNIAMPAWREEVEADILLTPEEKRRLNCCKITLDQGPSGKVQPSILIHLIYEVAGDRIRTVRSEKAL